MGVYNGLIKATTNDPANLKVDLPVKLTVTANPNASELKGTVTSDRPGGPLAGATVKLTMVGQTTPFATLTTGADGKYDVMVKPANVGDVSVEVSLTGYQTDTAVVTITAPGPITHDVVLKLDFRPDRRDPHRHQ